MKAFAKRVSSSVALLLLLTGPTPGAIGSCDDDTSDDFIDLVDYCEAKEQLICARAYYRGVDGCDEDDPGCKKAFNDLMQDCRHEAIDICRARSWASDCRPTVRQANACLYALEQTSTLETPEDEIDECDPKHLCTVNTKPFDAPDGGGL